VQEDQPERGLKSA